MLRRPALLPGLILSSLLAASPAAAAPVLLDRVVAIVDDRAIFRSEVISASKPFFGRLTPLDRSDTKKVDEVLKAMLTRMIDMQLIEREAKRLHIVVDDAEIDSGLKAIANLNRINTLQVIEEAKRQGLTEAEYRAEIGRQVLEGKWIQVRVKPHVRIEPITGTEEEREQQHEILIDAEKKKQLAQLRAESFVEVHW